ncbi:MAG: hypothetical protein ACOX8Q_06095 [Christensenellales bacterium]|jgi:hypothetical protein
MPKKDLRQMKNNKNKKQAFSKEDIREAAKKANIDANLDNVDNKSIENVEEMISRYGSKNESELMGDLEHIIEEGKKDGTFSDEMLDAFVKNVAPMMDSEQRKKLQSIAKMIKMNKL